MAPAERPVRAVVIATALGTAVGAIAILSIVSTLTDGSSAAWGGASETAVWGITAAVVVLQSLAQLWRRRIADAAWLVAAALPLVPALTVPGELFSVTAFPVLVASFLAGVHAPLQRVRWWGLAAGAFIAIGQFVNALGVGRTDLGGVAFESLAQAALVVGVPLLPATVIQAQRAARVAQQGTLDALTRERDAQIGEALALERAAMARELHDIAAHHLSGISLMASAIEGQVRSDPDAARAGARQIRQQSRAILDDLRRLVGLLREAGDGDQAVKTLATISEVVRTAEAAGATVRLDVRPGPSRELGEGISPLGQLAAYRMVQESLTNALRYAPGAACVIVIDDSDPRRLRVNVRNDPPPPGAQRAGSGSGFGVLGMKERATLIGGYFEAGPTGDDGWEARMSIPREDERSLAQEKAP
ncbi:sensor histidine kinase [Microbacterium sp. RD1]|uniref:sensor histidine kinase n=1 Tax=Microbacterium sp. RD1 TaxID=3457313 RepID=UPI003FA574EC